MFPSSPLTGGIMTTYSHRITYDRAALCAALGISERVFDNARKKLEAEGFPKRLPGLARWSRAAIDAWVAANGDTETMRSILVGPEPQTPSGSAHTNYLLAKYSEAS